MTTPPGEFELIELLTGFIRNKDTSIVRDFGDDTAFVKQNGKLLLLTVDTLVEGVHFLRFYPPASVGWKLISVNASDVAAKGGKPLYSLVTLGVPKEIEIDYLKGIYRGFAAALDFYKFSLVGGNTTRSERLCLDLSLIGEAKRAIFRDTPEVGDKIFVSGTLGDSRAGLELLLKFAEREQPRGYFKSLEELSERAGFEPYEVKLVKKHLEPIARLDLSPAVERFANASMDISDGFISDLAKMVKNFTAEVDLSKLPLSEELVEYCTRRRINPTDYALYGGEDYELLVCSGEDLTPFGFTEVGRVISEGEGKIYSTEGVELKVKGFDHLG